MLLLPLLSCGGGGGGSSSASSGRLLGVTFQDLVGANAEPETLGPQDAPLIQSVVFEFSDVPPLDDVGPQTIRIQDQRGVPVEGTYQRQGSRVTFTPTLPRQSPDAATADNGGAGLHPATTYQVRLGPGTWPEFLVDVDKSLLQRHPDPADPRGVMVPFRTTELAERYFLGLVTRRPRLLEIRPQDGSTGISPWLYSDPDGWFPPSQPFELHFDGPLDPHQVGDQTFFLIDLDHRTPDHPHGLPLGVSAKLRENTPQRSIVELTPTGILPFGHMLSLEAPQFLASGEVAVSAGSSQALTEVAATFTVAESPGPTIRDTLVENFEDQVRQERDPELLERGEILAGWDENDSGVLQAAFGFEGSGELGRFLPLEPTRNGEELILDTDVQSLPIDATPDVSSPTVVVGGVFHFTDIDIPEGVTLRPLGSQPLILTATGSVRIAGSILLDAEDGRDEFLFDSSNRELAGGRGGPGGGRGGEGHPLHYIGNFVTTFTQTSPPAGGRGWGPRDEKRTGGYGGQSGIRDHPNDDGEYGTGREINCCEIQTERHNNGWKGPGGGGGSFKTRGTKKKNGSGNVLADGQGNFIIRTPETHGPDFDVLLAGRPGDSPFRDENPNNDMVGGIGEMTRVGGGEGGGAGASILDAYFCGIWCRRDADPNNDELCEPEFGDPPRFADTVGDARGGSAGGGGGALLVKALGSIHIESTALISARGGDGGGGEAIGCGNWAGCAGGGSGGALLFESALDIRADSGARVVCGGGTGSGAFRNVGHPGNASCSKGAFAIGAGGDGGVGIVQFRAPPGVLPEISSSITPRAWVDKTNARNPAQLGPISRAISTWYDMGRTIQRAPAATNPVFRFRGTDPVTGMVVTDAEGNVIDPTDGDIRVDFLGIPDPDKPGEFLNGQEPRPHFIPSNARVFVEFQGAHAAAEGSREVDLESLTEWSPRPSIANGMQFLRYRITFDVGVNGNPVQADTPKPTVQSLQIHAEF